MTALSVVHEFGSAVSVSAAGVELLRYVYRSDTAAHECPAPYFHPLRNLAGDVVTGHRPHDHRWHKGLAMTASHVSGENFWGGGSYVDGVGYQDLPNVGSLCHRGFAEFSVDDGLRMVERVDWVSAAGERWIEENRTIAVRDVDTVALAWSLEFSCALTNVRSDPLEFGSPTVFGRELAGYCGFFWRGPRSFAGGQVLADGGRSGPGLMGERAEWLAYVGAHDGVDTVSTLIFDQDPDYPAHWFVRAEPYAVVNPSLAFWQPVRLEPGQTMTRRYRLIVVARRWGHGQIEVYRADHPW